MRNEAKAGTVGQRFSLFDDDAREGATTGEFIDRQGFDSARIAAFIGENTSNPSAHDHKFELVQSPNSNGSPATVFAVIEEDIDAPEQFFDRVLNIRGAARYIAVRVTMDFTGGTTPGCPVFGVIGLCGPADVPVAEATEDLS
jgi:hypothetical protein